jgi:hypothetical protein
VGAYAQVITEALLKAKPEWRDRELVDDLRVTALYAKHDDVAVCLLAYDIGEIMRREVPPLKHAVAQALDMPSEAVYVYCSHTHSSSMEESSHDADLLAEKTVAAAVEAKTRAVSVNDVGYLRVDTGTRFNINRRSVNGEWGVWCLMQSKGCTDDGHVVDGTERARDKLISYGAGEKDVATVTGPIAATRPNDPNLDLILFPKADGGYAAGIVRFTAHPVICSAGYWKPNLGRDYPGPLCDRLSEELGCPVLFLQGPCGDHRPRHREVGIAERDRIGLGLAETLIERLSYAEHYPLNELEYTTRTVVCPLRSEMPLTEKDARRDAYQANKELKKLPRGTDLLMDRKALGERIAFYRNAAQALSGTSYLTKGEGQRREAPLDVSHIAFGPVHLLNFPGELFSTVTRPFNNRREDPVVVASFANGVAGYLLPEEDLVEGAYESTWALFTPESIMELRTAAKQLLEE